MRGHRNIIIGMLGIASLAGCKRKVEPQAPPAAPTTRVAATRPAPTTKAVETLPVFFTINDQTFTFPQAKLVTRPVDGGLRVTLFSDDPPEAVRDGYQGNSFYFRFVLDSAGAADLDGQQFVFRNSFTEQDDTTNGLFIAGGRQTLRPIDAGVGFEVSEQNVIVHVAGTFKLIDEQTGADAPVAIRVRSRFEPVMVAPATK